MTSELMTYYVPNNPNIPKGHIYTLYINHNTNLDLSSIINLKTININNITQDQNGISQETSQITISKEDYTKLLELNNEVYQLTNKRTEYIQSFIENETRTTAELARINTKRQELIKQLTKKGPIQWII